MPYYCESFPDAINHMSPSVSMYVHEVLTNRIDPPRSVLDLGAGNGRNSLALARRFNCETTLVDCDPKMLEMASHHFGILNLKKPTVLACQLENLSDVRELGDRKFDVVIMSYVLHHIEPHHHQAILEFCKARVRGHLLVDVYWNRLRCAVGQYVHLPDANWYGLSYEELADQLSSRFKIEYDRIQILATNVVFNLVLSLIHISEPTRPY